MKLFFGECSCWVSQWLGSLFLSDFRGSLLYSLCVWKGVSMVGWALVCQLFPILTKAGYPLWSWQTSAFLRLPFAHLRKEPSVSLAASLCLLSAPAPFFPSTILLSDRFILFSFVHSLSINCLCSAFCGPSVLFIDFFQRSRESLIILAVDWLGFISVPCCEFQCLLLSSTLCFIITILHTHNCQIHSVAHVYQPCLHHSVSQREVQGRHFYSQ